MTQRNPRLRGGRRGRASQSGSAGGASRVRRFRSLADERTGGSDATAERDAGPTTRERARVGHARRERRNRCHFARAGAWVGSRTTNWISVAAEDARGGCSAVVQFVMNRRRGDDRGKCRGKQSEEKNHTNKTTLRQTIFRVMAPDVFQIFFQTCLSRNEYSAPSDDRSIARFAHEMMIEFIITGLIGLSLWSQRVLPILLTTSMPEMTLPNTGCCDGTGRRATSPGSRCGRC